MNVKIQEVFVEVETAWGKTKKQHGHSRVLVENKLAGYVPIEGEPCAGVFHPLPNFPKEIDSAVVQNSGGKLTRSLRQKKAKNEQSVEQTGKQKA